MLTFLFILILVVVLLCVDGGCLAALGAIVIFLLLKAAGVI